MNQIENHFRSVTVMPRSTKTPKGIQVPGSISFKRLLKEAWKIASSILKMAVKFSYEKYTSSGENSSPTLTVWCQTKHINFREIQASLNGKTARYPARKILNIMDIESTTCVLEVPHANK